MNTLKELLKDKSVKNTFKVFFIWLILSLIFIGLTYVYIDIASYFIIKYFLLFICGQFTLAVLYICLLIYLLLKFIK